MLGRLKKCCWIKGLVAISTRERTTRAHWSMKGLMFSCRYGMVFINRFTCTDSLEKISTSFANCGSKAMYLFMAVLRYSPWV